MQQRRQIRPIPSFGERLAQEAKRLREQAKLLPPGTTREAVLRKTRQAETGAHVTDWRGLPA